MNQSELNPQQVDEVVEELVEYFENWKKHLFPNYKATSYDKQNILAAAELCIEHNVTPKTWVAVQLVGVPFQDTKASGCLVNKKRIEQCKDAERLFLDASIVTEKLAYYPTKLFTLLQNGHVLEEILFNNSKYAFPAWWLCSITYWIDRIFSDGIMRQFLLNDNLLLLQKVEKANKEKAKKEFEREPKLLEVLRNRTDFNTELHKFFN